MSLRKPVNPYVYNLRSSYQSEAHRAVEQIVGMGITRIGLIYVDDPFGVDAVAGVMDGLEKTGARAAYIEKFDRKAASDTLDRIANVALQANAPAVIVIATNEPTIALIRSLRQRGNRGYVVTLSNNASGSFIEQLGPAGAGVIVAQVFPGERRTDIGLVKEATELLRGSKTHREMKVSPSLLEGVAAAKLLVAALQMTPGASPKQLTDVLQSGVAFDVGWPGYRVAYTPTDHSGIDFVDLSIVSSTGGFRR